MVFFSFVFIPGFPSSDCAIDIAVGCPTPPITRQTTAPHLLRQQQQQQQERTVGSVTDLIRAGIAGGVGARDLETLEDGQLQRRLGDLGVDGAGRRREGVPPADQFDVALLQTEIGEGHAEQHQRQEEQRADDQQNLQLVQAGRRRQQRRRVQHRPARRVSSRKSKQTAHKTTSEPESVDLSSPATNQVTFLALIKTRPPCETHQ